MAGNLQPLDEKFAIVDDQGRPTLYFIKWCQQRQIDITEALTLLGLEEYLLAHQLQEGNGIQITPSGNLTDSPTIDADAQEILDQISTTRGSIIYRGLTGWAPLVPGAAGNILQTNGAGADPTWVAPPSGSGKLIYVAGASIAGAAATTLTVSGLDLNAHGLYQVTARLKNATASAPDVSMFYNADTVAGNYFRSVTSNGASTQANNAVVTSFFATTGENLVDLHISRIVDRIVANGTGAVAANSGANIRAQGIAHQWTTTGTNVTGITLSASVASALAIGSRIDVWRIST